MSIVELREKIVEEVNHLDDENMLQQMLTILSSKEESKPQMVDAMTYKDHLFEKHNGLLERLS